jgi:hypothetical protein
MWIMGIENMFLSSFAILLPVFLYFKILFGRGNRTGLWETGELPFHLNENVGV